MSMVARVGLPALLLFGVVCIVLRGEARGLEQGGEQAGLVERVAGHGPERAARAAERTGIRLEFDLVAHEGVDLPRRYCSTP